MAWHLGSGGAEFYGPNSYPAQPHCAHRGRTPKPATPPSPADPRARFKTPCFKGFFDYLLRPSPICKLCNAVCKKALHVEALYGVGLFNDPGRWTVADGAWRDKTEPTSLCRFR